MDRPHFVISAVLLMLAGCAVPAARRADALMSDLYAQGGFTGAVVIMRDGETLYERGFGMAEEARPFTPETATESGSSAKPATAASPFLKWRERRACTSSDRLQRPLDPRARMKIHPRMQHNSAGAQLRLPALHGSVPIRAAWYYAPGVDAYLFHDPAAGTLTWSTTFFEEKAQQRRRAFVRASFAGILSALLRKAARAFAQRAPNLALPR